MQYRVYKRQTLKYVDGGYVQEFNVDDDYIVNNNSTVSVVKSRDNTLSKVVTGDIIALIKDSGAYHKGVITAVDDTAFTISYKSDKELFNDNIPNPHSGDFAQNNELKIAGKFGVDYVIEALRVWFSETDDMLKRLPITFVADGDVLDENGEPKMMWTWSNDSINLVDWITELFEKYNLSLSFDIDFDISNNNLKDRKPKYIVTLSAITKSGGIVKDNVAMQTITYTVKELPDATVCRVIDSTDKQLCYISSGKNLLNPATVEENHYIYYSTKEGDSGWREGTSNENNFPNTNISSYISYDPKSKYTYSQNSGDEVTRCIIAYDKAKNKLGYFNYAATTTGAASFTFNVENFKFAVPKGDEQTNEELAAAVKYIRINYYNGATEVQLEKGEVKTSYDKFNKPAIFYLYEKNGEYSISTENKQKLDDGRERVLPVKTVIATFSQNSNSTDETTPQDMAKDKLIPSQFNQAIEIKINSDSKMFDFANAKFGDQYQIINEQGNVNSTFTGKKFSNKDKWVTIYFGLGRQNYTDLIQMRLRKQRELGIGQNGKNGKNGENGTNGANGKDGQDGAPGQDGQDGQDGKTAYEIAVENGFEGTEEEWLESLKGDKGDPGKDGQDGAPGQDGQDGQDGKTPYIGENGNWWIGDEDTGVSAGGYIIGDGKLYGTAIQIKSDFQNLLIQVQTPYNYSKSKSISNNYTSADKAAFMDIFNMAVQIMAASGYNTYNAGTSNIQATSKFVVKDSSLVLETESITLNRAWVWTPASTLWFADSANTANRTYFNESLIDVTVQRYSPLSIAITSVEYPEYPKP